MNPEIAFKRIDQVCIVVRDLQKTIEHYWNYFGIGPWKIFLLQEPLLREMTIKGEPAKYKMHVAMCQMENVYIEIIQPVSGDTLYKEFLEEKGEGLHHLGFFVENLDREMERFEAKGFRAIQTGRFQGGGFAYFDTQEKFGTLFELIERSRPRNTPIRVWPENESEEQHPPEGR
jgi:catechol 2,3-dioxygenase-like lactoylglutathione lyase family enzyme